MKWKSISELPSASHEAIFFAAEYAAEFGRTSAVAPNPLATPPANASVATEVHKAEAVASRAFRILTRALKGEHPLIAAKAIFRLTEEFVTGLNSLSESHLELFQQVAAQSLGWPVMHSDLLDEKDRNRRLIETLKVGCHSGFNALKRSPNSRTRRFSQEDPLTKFATGIIANIVYLRSIQLSLTSDSCPQDHYERRVAGLAKRFNLPASFVTVLLEWPEDPGRPSRKTLGAFQRYAWKLLMLDTESRPEQVLELRKAAMSKALSATSEVDKLQESLNLSTDNAVLNHLRTSLGEKGIEGAIRDEIRNKLRQRLASILR